MKSNENEQTSVRRLKLLFGIPIDGSSEHKFKQLDKKNKHNNNILESRLENRLENIDIGGNNYTETMLIRQSKYGLGDRRSYEQLVQFSGIDTVHHKIVENRCGNIEYVPFIEHPLGADYVPKFDSVTEAFVDERDIGSIYHPNYNPPNKNGKKAIPVDSTVSSNPKYLKSNSDIDAKSSFKIIPKIVDTNSQHLVEKGVFLLSLDSAIDSLNMNSSTQSHLIQDYGLVVIVVVFILCLLGCARKSTITSTSVGCYDNNSNTDSYGSYG